jgi:hypothetical protein
VGVKLLRSVKRGFRTRDPVSAHPRGARAVIRPSFYIGSNARLGDMAAYMQDLGDAVNLGERWEYRSGPGSGIQLGGVARLGTRRPDGGRRANFSRGSSATR